MPDSLIESLKTGASSGYGVLVLLGVILSLLYWMRAARGDSRMFPIYLGSLAGAFIGAKVSYLLAEGWLHQGPDWWIHWLYGKSITGALFGGYFGVEFGKRLVDYRTATGDRFALIVPLAVVMGRLGCLSHGCCQGRTFSNGFHWPSVQVEIGFNLFSWAILMSLRGKSWATNQLFHLYLIGYGIFRFFHEFLRETPKIVGPLSGYQFVALALVILGAVGFTRRAKARATPFLS